MNMNMRGAFLFLLAMGGCGQRAMALGDAAQPAKLEASVAMIDPSVTRVTVGGVDQLLFSNGQYVAFRYTLEVSSYDVLVSRGPIEVVFYAEGQILSTQYFAPDICRTSCGTLLCMPGDDQFTRTKVEYQTVHFDPSGFVCLQCDGRLGLYGACS
jgi:hypothetical protein